MRFALTALAAFFVVSAAAFEVVFDIVRTRIAEILQIPRENRFALLRAIGGDCAGAVSFLEESVWP